MVEDTITIRVIHEARNEDRNAMNEMVRSFQPVLFYIASCHLKSEELIQSTVRSCLGRLFVLLSETENLAAFNGKAMSMVVRTCLNAALTEDHDRRFFPLSGSDPAEETVIYTSQDEVPALKDSITEREAMNLVVRILRRLPDDQRMVFVMRYLDGMPFARISRMIHVPEERIKQRVQLAKQRLAGVTRHTIPQLFGIIQLAEANKYLVIDEPEDRRASEVRKASPAKTERNAPKVKTARIAAPKADLRMWFGAAAVFFVLTAAAELWAYRRPAPISLATYLTWSFSGMDGLGSAEALLADTGNTKLNALLEDSGCGLKNADGTSAEDGALSNGDVLTWSCAFSEEALKKARLDLTETSVDVTVNGLQEPEEIDLFADVHLEEGTDETTGLPVLTAVSEDERLQDVHYRVVSENEEGILVEAEIPSSALLSLGYVTDTYSRMFSEEEVPASMRSYVRSEIVANGLRETAEHFDEYGYEIANGSDPEINALAQKYIGRGGACNEIANAFIYELYGVRVKTGYNRQNTYEVSFPEPGDLIYYYDSNGNYTHVATYIGNGLVLNGNYGDGRTHITSMYESLYAANPMTFLRVER